MVELSLELTTKAWDRTYHVNILTEDLITRNAAIALVPFELTVNPMKPEIMADARSAMTCKPVLTSAPIGPAWRRDRSMDLNAANALFQPTRYWQIYPAHTLDALRWHVFWACALAEIPLSADSAA
jgi:hypothetical protein